MNIEPISQLSEKVPVNENDKGNAQKKTQKGVQKNTQESKKKETGIDAERLQEAKEFNTNDNRISEKELKKERVEIEKTVEDMNSFLDSQKNSLSFFVDEDSGRHGVKVVDSKTNEIIKQIPPDEVLDVAAKIKDMLGALVDKTV